MTDHAFTQFSRVVPPEWIDYNGHMNEALYSHALVEANEAFLDFLDLGQSYLDATGCALYTVESHLYFLKECGQGEVLRARSRVEDAGEKVLRVATVLTNDAGEEVLRGSNVYLHVGPSGVEPFPPERRESLAAMAGPSPTAEP